MFIKNVCTFWRNDQISQIDRTNPIMEKIKVIDTTKKISSNSLRATQVLVSICKMIFKTAEKSIF